MNKDEFLEAATEAEWLEDWKGCERWTNGEGEGSLHESVWFCKECGEQVDSPLDGCECVYDQESGTRHCSVAWSDGLFEAEVSK